MSAEDKKVTVADLVATLNRIESWMQAVRKGLESLPQDSVLDLTAEEFQDGMELRQFLIARPC